MYLIYRQLFKLFLGGRYEAFSYPLVGISIFSRVAFRPIET